VSSVHKTVLIWHSARQMFDLVANVDRYPEFLPWCDRASVKAQQDDGLIAELGLQMGGVRQSFTTRNTHVTPEGSALQIRLELLSGPFSKLEGAWLFTPLGDISQQACRVDLQLDYDFQSGPLKALIGPVFDRIASNLVDAFVKRADEIHG
jgi:ribosome-associated toxin RatA of RatAB toxin-antitoxin module